MQIFTFVFKVLFSAYECRYTALATAGITSCFSVSRPSKVSIIEHGVRSYFVSYYNGLEGVCLGKKYFVSLHR